jgi:hypothetical protein
VVDTDEISHLHQSLLSERMFSGLVKSCFDTVLG